MINLRELRRRLIVITLVIIIIFGAHVSISYSQEKNAEQKDEESLGITDSIFAITEAKSFLGGAWFNQDVVFFLSSFILIYKNSLFSGSESISVPYANVKKIEFITGENTHKVIITYDEGGLIMKGSANFILKNHNSLELAYSNIGKRTNERIPLIQKATLYKKINAVISNVFFNKKN